MGLRRTLLRPVAFLAGMHASRQLRAFLRALERTAGRAGRAAAAAGRGARGERLRPGPRLRPHPHVRGLPLGRPGRRLREPGAVRPAGRSEGRTEALLPPGEPVLMFSMTSGTTGQPKHIPVTRAFLRTIRRGWNIFGLAAAAGPPRRLAAGHPARSPPPCARASAPRACPAGRSAACWRRRRRRSCGGCTSCRGPSRRWATRRPRTTRSCAAAVGQDVAIITTANPSSAIRLAETGAGAHRAADPRRPRRHVHARRATCRPDAARPCGSAPRRPWPRRLEEAVRRDGRAPAAPLLEPLVPGQLDRRHAAASTCRACASSSATCPSATSACWPARAGSPSRWRTARPPGVAEITGNFLEFIPAEQREQASPRRPAGPRTRGRAGVLPRLHQLDGPVALRPGRPRPRHGPPGPDARLRVPLPRQPAPPTSPARSSPSTRWSRRCASPAGGSAAGPWNGSSSRAASPTCLGMNSAWRRRPPSPPAPWPQAMDEALAELNIEYRSKRKSGRLGPVRPVLLPPGTLLRREEQRLAERRGRGEQYKHQYLLSEVIRE